MEMRKVYVVIYETVCDHYDCGVKIDSIYDSKEKAETRCSELKKNGYWNPYWDDRELQ